MGIIAKKGKAVFLLIKAKRKNKPDQTNDNRRLWSANLKAWEKANKEKIRLNSSSLFFKLFTTSA